jgi:hypothetical protein
VVLRMSGMSRTGADDAAGDAVPSDFSAIEDLDPSIADGSHVVYDRETPFELRLQVCCTVGCGGAASSHSS